MTSLENSFKYLRRRQRRSCEASLAHRERGRAESCSHAAWVAARTVPRTGPGRGALRAVASPSFRDSPRRGAFRKEGRGALGEQESTFPSRFCRCRVRNGFCRLAGRRSGVRQLRAWGRILGASWIIKFPNPNAEERSLGKKNPSNIKQIPRNTATRRR